MLFGRRKPKKKSATRETLALEVSHHASVKRYVLSHSMKRSPHWLLGILVPSIPDLMKQFSFPFRQDGTHCETMTVKKLVPRAN